MKFRLTTLWEIVNDDRSFSRMFLNAEIEKYEFCDPVQGLDILRIHIKDCDEIAEIVCNRR
jgi:hypothetical protein